MAEFTADRLFQVGKTISEENSTPLYIQLLSLIKQLIYTGALKPGDLVPPETQICKVFKLSRTTVRQALDQLVEEGLIIRRRGKGSFIANPKLNRSLNHMYSFTEDMQSLGLVPHSSIHESAVIDAPADVLKALNLPAGSKVFKLSRVRYANQEPLLFESTFIPAVLCPGIENEDFSTSSLYYVLRTKFNLNMDSASETYEVSRLSREMVKLLQCGTTVPAFHLKRIACLTNGIPFEYTNSFVRGDKCIFKVELQSNKKQIQFSREITI
ncbi:MAG: GntR family transcriptional regulator [Clostridia bacterium]|nr:GntR family transcriptional regulator [Clostridia bacterium]